MRKRCIQYCLLLLFVLPAWSNAISSDGDRKGFMFGLGIGGGYTHEYFASSFYNDYTTFGLGLRTGLGYAPNNRSAILLGIKSNIFVNEVSAVYSNWLDKMEGDGLCALGATFISPLVFLFAPLFRSHSLNGSLEYIHFTKETAPSLLFSGSIGLGILYDQTDKGVYGGLGFSVGTGYEFVRKGAVHLDFLYSSTMNSTKAWSVLVTLNKYFY